MWHLNLHLITVSLSPLETRGNHFRFLFSIGHSGLSSSLLTLSIVCSLTWLWKMMTIEIMTKVLKVSIKCQPRVLGPSNCCKEMQLAIFLGNWQLSQKNPIGTIKHSAGRNNQPCTSAQVPKCTNAQMQVGIKTTSRVERRLNPNWFAHLAHFLRLSSNHPSPRWESGVF